MNFWIGIKMTAVHSIYPWISILDGAAAGGENFIAQFDYVAAYEDELSFTVNTATCPSLKSSS